MEYKVFDDTIVVRLQRGEEIIESLAAVCEREQITLGTICGLGAVDQACVGLYKVAEQQYYPTELSGEMELTSLIGNVTRKDGAVYLHMHATFADGEAKVWGGHLNSARISATAEIFIRKVQGYVDRKQDEQTGINLLSL